MLEDSTAITVGVNTCSILEAYPQYSPNELSKVQTLTDVLKRPKQSEDVIAGESRTC